MRNEVVIVNDPVTLYTDIYVFMGEHVGRYVAGGLAWHQHEPGTKPETPTIRLDRLVWESIVRAAVGPAPSDDAVQDARKVRDRLLAMVESEWQSRQLDKP